MVLLIITARILNVSFAIGITGTNRFLRHFACKETVFRVISYVFDIRIYLISIIRKREIWWNLWLTLFFSSSRFFIINLFLGLYIWYLQNNELLIVSLLEPILVEKSNCVVEINMLIRLIKGEIFCIIQSSLRD